MRAASATPFRESFDFTPNANRAERVQTVNSVGREPGFRPCVLFQGFGAPDHVADNDSSQRRRERSFGFGQSGPDDLVNQCRAGEWRLVGFLDPARGAQDIVG